MPKIAIFSDSHDNIWNLEKALNQANEMEPKHCCTAAI